VIKFSFILVAGLFVGLPMSGCSIGGGQSRGPGETWVVGIAGDADSMERAQSMVGEQQGYGWSTHLCVSEQDGSLAEYVVGPVVYSKRDEEWMSVPYALMAEGGSDSRLSGLLSITAEGVGKDALREGWDDGFVFRVVIDEPLEMGFVTVPKIGRNGTVVVRWEAEGDQ
jgi:hypothetical protein